MTQLRRISMETHLLRERTRRFREAAQCGPSTGADAYKGLDAHAKPGLHGFVADLARQRFPAGAQLLDCAAGSGALTLRLQDVGFSMHATDYVAENFRLPHVPFRALDLNECFASVFTEQFDGVIAAEIIEHLENPRHFLRECWKLLKPGGEILLTTPNAGSPVSKAFLLRHGHAPWFSERDYQLYGHITPITARMLTQCSRESGFSIELMTSFGDALLQCRGSPRLGALARLISLVDMTPQELRGEILVSVLRKQIQPS
jgi:SAM-dependent methyltransferase